MAVTECHGQGISGIGAWRGVETEQDLDHMLYLLFFSVTLTNSRLLDLVGCVFVDHEALLNTGDDGRAARLAQLQGRVGIFMDKYPLDGGLVRLVRSDQLTELLVDEMQFVTLTLALYADLAVRDRYGVIAVYVNDAVAGGLRAWVDTEDPGH